MIVFPNAKINLGLNIVSKRSDGYHNIETVFYPIAWQDALEIVESDKYQFTSSGLKIEGSAEDNLCTKAYNLLKLHHNIPSVHIHLHKSIPMGAGLGGGSSDAAFTLKALNILFNLSLSNEELQNYASQIGADCAFFIENKPVLAYEKGDKFKPLSINLSNYYIVIVYPEIHVSTAQAYAGVKPNNSPIIVEAILNLDFDAWKDELKNDFEKSVFENHSSIESIKNKMYEKGAKYASMSGSGSAVYGIFENEIPLNDFKNLKVWQGRLSV